MNLKQRPRTVLTAAITSLTVSGLVLGYATGFSNHFFLMAALLAPFISSVIIASLYSYLGDKSAYIGLFAALISFTSILQLKGSGFTPVYDWVPSLQITAGFMVDGLSVMMALLASGIGALIFLYSRRYMEHEDWKRKYYSVLSAFMGSMIGLVLSSDLILMFLFWEFTSVCSFLLISHSQRTASGIYASKKALLLTAGSGMVLLTGFLILGEAAGTYSLVQILSQDLSATLSDQGLYIAALVFIVAGAAAKSAQVPFHIWLPDAMEAPTPVSAFLHSATMVKAGVFLLARLRPALSEGVLWTPLLLSLGLLTMCTGAVLAVYAEELKELLAYSTASHLGLITAGLGFQSVLGAETASFHIFNHAVFKASLFMVAGTVLHETGTQKIRELSGLRKDWPMLAVVATVSALSMAGLPLLSGFYSKELLFKTSYSFASGAGGIAWLLPLVAVLGSVFTFMYSIRFLSVFYGSKGEGQHSLPGSMVLPPAVLASVAFMAGLMPNRFIQALVLSALRSVSDGAHGMSVHVVPGLKPAFGMSILTLGTGILAYRRLQGICRSIHAVLQKSVLTANHYYHLLLELSRRQSDWLTDLVETSLVRTYITWVLVVASLSALAGYIISGPLQVPAFSVRLPVAIVLATSVAAVYAVTGSDTYISSVLTLSILGFMVSIFYLLMDAPDLVMTQLVVESLTLIIFLLVLNRLPDYTKRIKSSRKMRDILISGSAGLMVFASVLYSTAEETPGKLAEYYIENALPGSGGTNVVNVILVDFRGLDTMGEISVIFMAGLAIMMLFRMRGEDK